MKQNKNFWAALISKFFQQQRQSLRTYMIYDLSFYPSTTHLRINLGISTEGEGVRGERILLASWSAKNQSEEGKLKVALTDYNGSEIIRVWLNSDDDFYVRYCQTASALHFDLSKDQKSSISQNKRVNWRIKARINHFRNRQKRAVQQTATCNWPFRDYDTGA